MFNNTTRVLLYESPDRSIRGVILPRSDKVLSLQDLDEKIKRATSHIAHLTSQLPSRATHGGTAFRAKNISLKDGISAAAERLHLLQEAKAAISEAQSNFSRAKSLSRQAALTASTISKTAQGVFSQLVFGKFPISWW